MNAVNMNQVVDVAGNFQNLAEQHGGMFMVGEQSVADVSGALNYFEPNKPEHKPLLDLVAQGAGIVPVNRNFQELVAMTGREFGLLQPGAGIRPAVVTSQSRSDFLHIAYLTGERDVILPNDIAAGAEDPLNGMLLQTAKTLFEPSIGTHGQGGEVILGEIGHRFGGLRTISDPAAMQAAKHGVDVTDAMVAGAGLPVAMTNSRRESGQDIPGAFDIVDDNGHVRRIPFATTTLGPNSGAILIDHPRFNQDTSKLLGGMQPAIAATGLAIVAKLSREAPIDYQRAAKKYGEQALGLQ